MDIEVIESPNEELMQFFEKKIEEFNHKNWEVKEKHPLVITVRDSEEGIVGGVAAKTFGSWLLIENLWVHESLRGKNMGTQILNRLESAARKRGCKYVLLDTLNFQARPFYEQLGYQVQWIQENYPKEGCKYFMTKEL
ncbi:MAG: GNAT family N-acetyltransferase [Bdellovibrionaceae bacterium]|nr:GNAT family N-acetyltransferase [Pseudobdellovibrionaceae bacterium]|tara:strand:+ start:1647 stop:2060 length:414 start_codon:yes stop_codon:yes gene_type:complete